MTSPAPFERHVQMSVIPPLSQSLVEMGSCPNSYLFQIIDGNKQTSSLQSNRGTECHDFAKAYALHCVKRGVPMDRAVYDKLSAAAGPEAGRILDRLRDTWVIDFEHVYALEVRWRLDEDLNPTVTEETAGGVNGDYPLDIMEGVTYSGKPAAHAGTPDVFLIMDDKAMDGKIEDYKSHPQPFEPDTYQSMLYPFMAFKHFPSLRRVTFELVFIRLGFNVRRAVTWYREDMPDMAVQIKRARERQVAVHAAGEGPAFPGSHCQYCPKITTPTMCPISEFNPQINTSMEERLRFNVWAAEMAKVNREVMKNYCAARDPDTTRITIFDANGKATQYGYLPAFETIIEASEQCFAVFVGHSKKTGESLKALGLRISSKVMSKLTTKKRSALFEALSPFIHKEPKQKWGFCKADAADVDTGYGEEDF